MATSRLYRGFAIVAALSIVLASTWYAYRAIAQQQPTMLFTLGLSNDRCVRTGDDQPAGSQSQPIGIVLRGFQREEPVYISVTFPDGRVFSLIPAALQPAGSFNGLDGIIDRPPNPSYTVQTSVGGDFYQTMMPNTRWPYGCYTFNALGVNSGSRAMGFYVIQRTNNLTVNPGQATLQVVDKQTKAARGQQGTTVELFGRRFLASEQISVTLQLPNGVLLDLGSPATSPIGSFQTEVQLPDSYPTGIYTVTASGATYSVAQTYSLAAAPLLRNGWARLRIAWPNREAVGQGTAIELQGQQFLPGEPITIRALLPTGALRDIGVVAADANGEFAAQFALDQLFPLGEYQLFAVGSTSTFVATLSDGIDRFRLQAGSQHITEQVLTDTPAPPLPPPSPAPTAEAAGAGSAPEALPGTGADGGDSTPK